MALLILAGAVWLMSGLLRRWLQGDDGVAPREIEGEPLR
jgi:hypothetical protein